MPTATPTEVTFDDSSPSTVLASTLVVVLPTLVVFELPMATPFEDGDVFPPSKKCEHELAP